MITAPAASGLGNYHVTGLTSGHDYAFRIASSDSNGDANFSDPVDANAPQAVSNVQILSDGTAGTMTVSWDTPSSGVTPDGFYVYEDGGSTPIATISYSSGVTNYSKSISGVASTDSHQFEIVPFKTVGSVTASGLGTSSGIAFGQASGHSSIVESFAYLWGMGAVLQYGGERIGGNGPTETFTPVVPTVGGQGPTSSSLGLYTYTRMLLTADSIGAGGGEVDISADQPSGTLAVDTTGLYSLISDNENSFAEDEYRLIQNPSTDPVNVSSFAGCVVDEAPGIFHASVLVLYDYTFNF